MKDAPRQSAWVSSALGSTFARIGLTAAMRWSWAGVGVGLVVALAAPAAVRAQLVPDNTLPGENSTVTRINNRTSRIDGGARRASNLFHSFDAFNVGGGRTVNFANPNGVLRIFSRVTGDGASGIFGTLGVLGNADLFLINPNGIVFGNNFRLNMNGSLLLSTADAIGFENDGVFSATDPANSTLLTVNPNAFFFNARPDDSPPAAIRVNSGNNRNANRAIGNGETLAMVGGEVEVNGGRLRAQDGRIEVGAVGSGSTVQILPLAQGYDIEYEGVEQFDTVRLRANSRLITNGPRGGNIHLQGDRVALRSDARVVAHTEGNPATNGPREIRIQAVNEVVVDDAQVRAVISPTSTSNQRGADIIIGVENGRVVLRNTGNVSTRVEGIGMGGDVSVQAPEVRLVSPGQNNQSELSATVAPSGDGQGGNLSINTGRLTVNNSRVATTLSGQGTSGNLSVQASEIIEVSGRRSVVATDIVGRGTGGAVRLESPTIEITDEGRVSTSIVRGGAGIAGDITVIADEVILSSPRGLGFTGLFTQVNPNAADAMSESGDLTMTVDRLVMRDGAVVSSFLGQTGSAGTITIRARTIEVSGVLGGNRTDADGDPIGTSISAGIGLNGSGVAGSIDIETSQLTLTDGGQIISQTGGPGTPGNITIRADDIRLAGEGRVGGSTDDASAISVSTDGASDAGNIEVNANTLTLQDRAKITARAIRDEGTGNTGRPGQITLTIGEITLDEGVISSSVADGVAIQNSLGQLGQITINADALTLRDRAEIGASTAGAGAAGNIAITVSGDVQVSGNSRISSEVLPGGMGDGGNVAVRSDRLTIASGGRISASTQGGGAAGSIDLTVRDRLDIQGPNSGIFARTDSSSAGGNITIQNPAVFALSDGATVSANTTSGGNGGSIRLRGQQVSLTGGARISASTTGAGDGGSLVLTTPQLTVDGNSTIAASTAGDGQGGSITVAEASLVQVDNGGTLTANTSGSGDGGSIMVESDRVTVANQGRISASSTGTGNGGAIAIDGNQLDLTSGGIIEATTIARGNAGDIRLTLADSIQVAGPGTTIGVDTSGEGQGGNISLQSEMVTLSTGGTIAANTEGAGAGGDITVESDRVILDGGTLSAQTTGTGRGGTIRLPQSRRIVLDNGVISARSSGLGRGGNIDLNGDRIRLDNGSEIEARTGAAGEGRGGDVAITSDRLSLSNGSTLSASTSGEGRGGSIEVESDTAIVLNSQSTISARSRGLGRGGSITLESDRIRLGPGSEVEARTGTAGDGQGGDIEITARDVILDQATIAVSTAGGGQGGEVQIQAEEVALENRSTLAATTSGDGNGGEIEVESDRLSLDQQSVIAASTSGTGDGGQITVSTDQLSLQNGSRITADTTGSGNAGDINLTVNDTVTATGENTGVFSNAGADATGDGGSVSLSGARQLTLADGARLASDTGGSGQAGDVTIRVEDEIVLTGANTGIFASTEPGSTGDGGNIDIDPQVVRVEDGAAIAANSLGSGVGGNVMLQAGRLFLVNGIISAETNTADGGELALSIGDLLVLSDNSQISATAGAQQGRGDGGNISIDVAEGYVIALGQNNNDIVANAFAGNGGNITINANQIINLSPRSSQPENRTNDIDASSEFGSSGTITINGINVDPSRGLAALPTQIIDAARLVAQACEAGAIARDQSEFTIVGRGGLVAEPGNALGEAIWDDTRIPAGLASNRAFSTSASAAILPSAQPQPLIPAATTSPSALSSTVSGPISGPSSGSASGPNLIIPSAQPQPLIPRSRLAAPAPPSSEASRWIQDGEGNHILLTDVTDLMTQGTMPWHHHPSCAAFDP